MVIKRPQCTNREKNESYENDNQQIWARVAQDERGDTLVELVTSVKSKNYEYHVSEESREEPDVEKIKRCSEDRN